MIIYQFIKYIRLIGLKKESKIYLGAENWLGWDDYVVSQTVLDLGNTSGRSNMENEIKKRSLAEELVHFLKNNSTKILDILALVAGLAGIILTLFTFIKIKDFDGVKSYVTGIDLFFGKTTQFGFNIFSTLTFIIPILGLFSVPMSHYFKPIKGMSALFMLMSGILILLLPTILNPEGEKFTYIQLVDYSTIAVALFIFAAVALFISDYRADQFTISDISETAMLIAISIVLNYIKIPLGATGGSINLQIFPLAIMALRFSSSKTFLGAGIIYGLISCLLDGYGLQTFVFEYLIAFGSICILSFARKFVVKKGKATVYGAFLIAGLIIVSTLIRYMAASLDSVLFYNLTFKEGLAYNAIYVLPTGAITLVLVVLFYIKPLFFLNKAFPTTEMRNEVDKDCILDN